MVRSILKQVLTFAKVSGTNSFPERHFPGRSHLRWLLQENDIKSLLLDSNLVTSWALQKFRMSCFYSGSEIQLRSHSFDHYSCNRALLKEEI